MVSADVCISSVPLLQLGETHSLQLNLPVSIKREQVLEYSAQNSMVGLLTQLSLLSSYSTSLFSELVKEASSTFQRLVKIKQQVTVLQTKLPSLEQSLSTVSIENFLQNPRSEVSLQQQADACLFVPETRPFVIQNTYETRCAKPPALQKMDPFMDDNKKCLELYTNPRFFLDEWIQEQNKQRAAAREERRRKKEERRARREKEGSASRGNQLGPAKPKKMTRVIYDKNTGEKIAVKEEESVSSIETVSSSLVKPGSMRAYTSAPRPSGDLASAFQEPNGPSTAIPVSQPASGLSSMIHAASVPPPPPPEVPLGVSSNGPAKVPPPVQDFPPAPPPPAADFQPAVAVAVPPPAPPPPPDLNSSLPRPSGNLADQLQSIGSSLRHSEVPVAAKKQLDSRSTLLENIRSGIALKSSKDRQLPASTAQKSTVPNSVAEILARRIAIQGSSDSDESDDDDAWDND